MNKQRRKQIQDAISKIEALVQDILDDEIDAFENMPESLQASENGIASEDAQDILGEVVDLLEEAISCLEEI